MRSLATAGILCGLLVSAAAGASERPVGRSEEEHDAFGRVTRRADGERVVYPFDPALGRAGPVPLESGDVTRRARAAVGPAGAPPPAATLDVVEEWRRSIFGYAIGESGLFVVDLDADGDMEIVGAAGDFASDHFWFVLSPAAGGGYQHTYVSDELPGEIASLRVAQLDADPALEVVIGTGGRLMVVDGASHEVERSWSSDAGEIRGLVLADVDGDAALEAVFCDDVGDGALHVHDFATGATEYQAEEFACRDVAVGNVDGDPGLEIVVARGDGPSFVLDGASRLIEWAYQPGFGNRVTLADLNGDGRSEIIAAGVWQHLGILDATLQTEVASITTALDIAVVKVLDVEGDGPLELVYADAQWGGIHVHDAQTLALRWTAENPEHGVTDVAFGNVDGVAAPELVWGAGHTSTGPDHLYVFDTIARVREWESLDFRGPFGALAHGDVDADNRPELLYGSLESHSGPGDGVWFVHDAQTKALEYVSTPNGVNWEGLSRIVNANVDADPQQEVFVTSSDLYDGLLICFDGLTHAEQWQVRIPSGLSFVSLQVGNVDADPGLELVASVEGVHSGAPGTYVYVYDAGIGTLEWQSPSVSPFNFTAIPFLRLGNVDADPNVEIVFAAEGGSVYVADGLTHALADLGDHDVTALDLADRDGNGVAEIIVGTENGAIEVLNAAGTVVGTVATYPSAIDAVRTLDVTGDGVADYVVAVDDHVFVRDGASGVERWNSGRLRYGFLSHEVGQRDSLLVADVDLDGRKEIVVNLGSLGLRVFELPGPGDVALFVTDAPDPVVVGANVTYTWRVQNQGTSVATGVVLTIGLPAGAAFVSSTPGPPTCATGSGTLTCTLGSLSGGAATIVSVVMTPVAPGTLTTSGTVALTTPDPRLANNTATASTIVSASPEADLALTVDDGLNVARPGSLVLYRLVVTNAGPWPVSTAALVETISGLEPSSYFPSVGSFDSGTGIWTGMDLAPGASASMTVHAHVASDAVARVTYATTLTPSGGVTDPALGDNDASDTDLVRSGWTELGHGSMLSAPIPAGGDRYFVMDQRRGESYEVVLDAVSGDLGGVGAPAQLERFSGELTPLAEAAPAGVGFARSLRWQGFEDAQSVVRVASAGCSTDCGPDDVFRVRAYQTTYDIARFNNFGGQATVLFVQNVGNASAHGVVRFWSSFAQLKAEVPFAITAPNGLFVLQTATVPGLEGVSGSITIANDAPYGTLAGKAVSVEPATGFSFDSPMQPRPR